MPFLFPPFSKGFHLGFQVNGCAPGSVAHMPSQLHEERFSGVRTLQFQAGLRVVQPCLFVCRPPGKRSGRQKETPKGEKKKKWRGGKISLAPMPSLRHRAMERENRAQLSKAAD